MTVYILVNYQLLLSNTILIKKYIFLILNSNKKFIIS